MAWNLNSNKHKVMHGGYKGKPTKTDVRALFSLYAGIQTANVVAIAKKQEGIQLKLDFNGEGI